MPGSAVSSTLRTARAESPMSWTTVAERLSWIRTGLVVLFLVGIYTNVTPVIGGIPVPVLLSVVTGLLLLAVHITEIDLKTLALLGLLYLVGLASTIFSPGVATFLGEKLKSEILLILSSLCGLGFYLELRTWSARSLGGLFAGAVAIILAGLVLEILGPLKPVSDAFRVRVMPEVFLYTSDARDIALHGSIRPKLFTSEPSHVAKFLNVVVVAWMLASGKGRSLAFGFLALFAAALLTRSPTILIGMIAAQVVVISWTLRKLVARPGLNASSIAMGFLAVMASALVFFILAALGAALFSTRMEAVLSGGDASALVRLLTPVVIASEVLYAHPLFGMGIGGKEPLVPILLQAYSEHISTRWLLTQPLEAQLSALSGNFFLHWIYLGILGGVSSAVILFAIVRQWSRGTMAVGCFVILLILSFAHGDFFAPRYWFDVAMICAVAAVWGAERRALSAGGTGALR